MCTACTSESLMIRTKRAPKLGEASHAAACVGRTVVCLHVPHGSCLGCSFGWEARRITSSARISRLGGIVSPRALAVFRLRTSLKVVGCSTGRSAGFAPALPGSHGALIHSFALLLQRYRSAIRVQRHALLHAPWRPTGHPLHAVRLPVIPPRPVHLARRHQMPAQVLRHAGCSQRL